MIIESNRLEYLYTANENVVLLILRRLSELIKKNVCSLEYSRHLTGCRKLNNCFEANKPRRKFTAYMLTALFVYHTISNDYISFQVVDVRWAHTINIIRVVNRYLSE